MRTFEVELRRTSYIVLTIEAETVEEAEALAFHEIADRGDAGYADWEVESIEDTGRAE